MTYSKQLPASLIFTATDSGVQYTVEVTQAGLVTYKVVQTSGSQSTTSIQFASLAEAKDVLTQIGNLL